MNTKAKKQLAGSQQQQNITIHAQKLSKTNNLSPVASQSKHSKQTGFSFDAKKGSNSRPSQIIPNHGTQNIQASQQSRAVKASARSLEKTAGGQNARINFYTASHPFAQTQQLQLQQSASSSAKQSSNTGSGIKVKKRTIQNSVDNQQKQLINNITIQNGQILLNQLQASKGGGPEMNGSRMQANAILQPTTSSLFDISPTLNHERAVPLHTTQGVSQSTRHGGGKKFDRLNLTSKIQMDGIGFSTAQSTTNAAILEKDGGFVTLSGAEASINSQLKHYQTANRNMLGTNDSESQNTSQIDLNGQNQGEIHKKATRTIRQQVPKQILTNIKLGQMDKADIQSTQIRMPASTRNQANRKQLDGNSFPNRFFQESLGASVIVGDVPIKGGQPSTKNSSYMNDTSILMKAVGAQMRTPHGQKPQIFAYNTTKGACEPINEQSQSKNGQGVQNRRKSSIQAQGRQQSGNQQHLLNHGVNEPTKLQQFQNQINTQKNSSNGRQMIQVKASGSKEKRSGGKSKPQSIKIKLQNSQDHQRMQDVSDNTSQFLAGKFVNQSQPLVPANQSIVSTKQVKKVNQSSSVKPRPSERAVNQDQGHKSVTNKQSKLQVGPTSFENTAQIHQHGISSATNKTKTPFSFEIRQRSLGGDDSRLQEQQNGSKKQKQQMFNINQLQKMFNQLNTEQAANIAKALNDSNHTNQPVVQPKIGQRPKASAKVNNMKTQQLQLMELKMQEIAKVNPQFFQPSASVSNSQKAFNQANANQKIIYHQPSNSVGKPSSVSNKRPGKAANSVGQSKPPAHAQYFESATEPSKGASKGIQSNAESMGVGVHRQHGSTAITTPSGNTCVINITVENGQASNYMHPQIQTQIPFTPISQQQQQQLGQMNRNDQFTQSQFLEQQQKQNQSNKYQSQLVESLQSQYDQLQQTGNVVIGPNITKPAQIFVSHGHDNSQEGNIQQDEASAEAQTNAHIQRRMLEETQISGKMSTKAESMKSHHFTIGQTSKKKHHQKLPSTDSSIRQQQRQQVVENKRQKQFEAIKNPADTQNVLIHGDPSQKAPKAHTKIIFNEDDLQEVDSTADWNTSGTAKEINKEIASEQPNQFAVTSSNPFGGKLKQYNNLFQEKKMMNKTSDVGSILKQAKQDLRLDRQDDSGQPLIADEGSQLQSKPDTMSVAQKPTKSSNQRNKLSNTKPSKPNQLEFNQTSDLLTQAYRREKQAQLAQSTPIAAQVTVPAPEEVEAEVEVSYPLKVRQALKLFAKTGKLTDFEKTELLDYDEIYCLGLEAATDKVQGKPGKNHNYGYDDENGDYQVVLKDHLAYRFEVQDFLGKGSFGQALKCYDHKTKQIVAVKIIKNKKRYQHQAGVELKILQHLQEQDPEDTNNIIQILDHCIFRSHLIISFELFSINLYEFIKNNNFEGVSLSLIRRFAIQILQALKFLREEDIIHCDLKPENILLKSPDKSGIKIIDFGSSCFSDQRIYTYIQSRFYRAPEIILGIPYTTGIDMWSFGCILVELYTGIPIFPGESENEQLALIMQVFGVPHEAVLAQGTRRNLFFQENSNVPLQTFEDPEGGYRDPGSKPLQEIIGTESESFFDFIVQCLNWNPEERMTPFAALQHRWILEGLPERVLIHHQRMLGLDVPSETSQTSLTQHGHSTQVPVLQTDDTKEVIQQRSSVHDQDQATPFDDNFHTYQDDELLEESFHQEMLDVHNRSTQIQDQQVHPSRIINNGMAQQLRIESGIQNKNENQSSNQKPSKQEMIRTQPMPAEFLSQCRKAAQNEQNSRQQKQQALNKGNKVCENNIEIQDFDDEPETMAQQSDLPYQNNKSKTTNMSKILRNINNPQDPPKKKKPQIDNLVNNDYQQHKFKLPQTTMAQGQIPVQMPQSVKAQNQSNLQENQATPFSFLMRNYIRQTGGNDPMGQNYATNKGHIGNNYSSVIDFNQVLTTKPSTATAAQKLHVDIGSHAQMQSHISQISKNGQSKQQSKSTRPQRMVNNFLSNN